MANTVLITDPDKVWCPAAMVQAAGGAYSRPTSMASKSFGLLGCLGPRCAKWYPQVVADPKTGEDKETGAGWCGL